MRAIFLGFFGITVLVACDEAPIVAPTLKASPVAQVEPTAPMPPNTLNQQAFVALKDFRAANRRVPVKYSPALGRAARLHATDMSRRSVMSHTGSDGSTPAQRATRAGYRWCRIAENVPAGQPNLASVMQSWANSPGHRRNMLDMNVTQFGIAQQGRFWALVLGRPGC